MPYPSVSLSCFIAVVSSAAGQAATTASELKFESSNKQLESAFGWAKSQALAYSHDGTDPVGPWYEAALPGRNAFCMRDVSHQANGAAALGLNKANFNMLQRFAAAVAPERDWAGYWEIDVTGKPAPIDYVNDQDFWYNLPANFDVLDAVFRMWNWTGDDTYVVDPQFKRFFRMTSKEYIVAWQLEPERVLARPRIMNRRLVGAKNSKTRGIPSYDEGQGDFTLGVDLLAAEHLAFIDLAFLADRNQDSHLQGEYLQTAAHISELLEKYAWSTEGRHYHGRLSSTGVGHGTGDLFVLYFNATSNPDRIRGALDYLMSPAYLHGLNIELESYLPKILLNHGESAAAYERILALTDLGRMRREYPEVSFAIVDAFVAGIMGIEARRAAGQSDVTIQTTSRLLQADETATISGVHIQGGIVDVSHLGCQRTSFRNRSDKSLQWRACFWGIHEELFVNGKSTVATVDRNMKSKPMSSIAIKVAPGSEVTVSLH